MKLSPFPTHRARVEMVPLIDSMFILLIFFIYGMLTMVVHRGIVVELPRARAAAVDQKDYISVSVTRDGEVYLDREPIALRELTPRLQQATAANPEFRVYLGADREALHGNVVRVLDAVRRAGVRKVFFETELEEPPAEGPSP
jgi:biopolymer transport protein ExbD